LALKNNVWLCEHQNTTGRDTWLSQMQEEITAQIVNNTNFWIG